MLAGFLAVATLMGGTTAPDNAERNPHRYRVEFSIGSVIDLTAAGQGESESDITGTALVTLTLSDTAGGRIAHLVIDSLAVSATGQAAMGISQAAADALIGEWVHGYVVDGKLEGATTQSQEGNQLLSIVGGTLQGLFAGIDSRAASATSWSDTSAVESQVDETTRNTQTITDWSVTGRDGDAYMLSGASDGTVSMDSPEQQISGTIRNSITITSVIGGPSKAAILDSTQDLALLVSALPDPLPLQVRQKFTVTALQ